MYSYIFIKKALKIIELLKDNQNTPFPLAQCCAKPEKAMPDSIDLYLLHMEKYKKTV